MHIQTAVLTGQADAQTTIPQHKRNHSMAADCTPRNTVALGVRASGSPSRRALTLRLTLLFVGLETSAVALERRLPRTW